MKRLLLLLLTVTTLAPAFAQRSVNAKEIFDKLNRREAVTYDHVTIKGDLDLTELANKKRISEGGREETEVYLSTVDVPVTFRNCTFEGKVLAYKNVSKEGSRWNNSVTYNTNFTEPITIENCVFEDESAFKYSEFRQRALFTGTSFRKEALFKYAKFRSAANFSEVRFGGYANFKYAEYSEEIAFQKTRFDNYADFKYTKFGETVSFQNARFDQMADFKYTHLPRDTRFDAATFDGPTDFKYTTLNGRKFSPVR